jgi:CheY-like chemotaxis protein
MMDWRASQRTNGRGKPGGVLGVDGEGTITVVSPADGWICARPATELLGRNIAELLAVAEERPAGGDVEEARGPERRELLHELGNLVMTIHGSVELARRKLGQDTAVRRHLKDAKSSSCRAVRVVRELMGQGEEANDTQGRSSAGRAEAATDGRRAPRRTTILLVDDDPVLSLVTATHLEDLGYRVLTATAAEEALMTCAQRSDIDLLIADIHLSGFSGEVLAKAARSLRAELRVLCMSALSLAALRLRGMGEADAPYLRKPFTRPELDSAVREALAPAQ